MWFQRDCTSNTVNGDEVSKVGLMMARNTWFGANGGLCRDQDGSVRQVDKNWT